MSLAEERFLPFFSKESGGGGSKVRLPVACSCIQVEKLNLTLEQSICARKNLVL
jgi:hypothetical protein